MDERIVKINDEFKRYQDKMADLRLQQVAAVNEFAQRVAEKKIAEIREKIFGYGSEPGEPGGDN